METFKQIQTQAGIYKVNRYLMLVMFALCFILAIWALSLESFQGKDHVYSECPIGAKEGCYNSFYNNTNYCGKTIPATSLLCTVQHMEAGMLIGEKPPYVVQNFLVISMGIVFVVFLINHLLYNRKFNIKELMKIE